MTDETSLEQLREQIDQLDKQLLDLISQRARLAPKFKTLRLMFGLVPIWIYVQPLLIYS